ncbi:MAG: hypothetical protein ACREU7_01025 [Burkholderiales bacterium]
MSSVGTMEHRLGRLAGVKVPVALPLRIRQKKYQRVRPDALPESTHYRDDGCEINPSCLTCPLPRCRYEEPGGLRAIINNMRDQALLELRSQGAEVEELAAYFGVSRRTVFRVLGTAGIRKEASCA